MRVLILSASIGTGHVRAAEALEHAFHEKGLTVDVRHEDSLQFANAPFRKLYQRAYVDLAASLRWEHVDFDAKIFTAVDTKNGSDQQYILRLARVSDSMHKRLVHKAHLRCP